MIFVAGSSLLIRRLNARPSMNGILMSVIKTSGLIFRTSGSAISPSEASPAKTNPYFSHGIISRSPSRTRRSSSVKKTLSIAISPCFRLHIKSELCSVNVYLCMESSGAGRLTFRRRLYPSKSLGHNVTARCGISFERTMNHA